MFNLEGVYKYEQDLMRSLSNRYIAFFMFLISLQTLTAEECEISVLSFEAAVQKAFQYSPELKIFETSISVRQAEGWQAGLWPNPEFTFEIDDFGCSNNHSSRDSEQLNYYISQLFELGGKRCSKIRIAELDGWIEYWNWNAQKQHIRNKISHAFIDIASARETLKILEELKQVEENRLHCLATMVQEGKIPLPAQKKTEIDLRLVHSLYRRKIIELESAKKKLSALWGCLDPDFTDVEFCLFEASPLCCLEQLEGRISLNPAYIKQQLEIVKKQEEVALAKAYAVPDVIVTAGYKNRLRHCGHAFEVDVTVPIPIFDQNQGSICRARLLTKQAELELERLQLQLCEQLQMEFLNWDASFQEAEALSSGLIPDAAEILKHSVEGHHEGKFPCFELFEAQKTALEIKRKYIDVLSDLHHQEINVMELVGPCDFFEEE